MSTHDATHEPAYIRLMDSSELDRRAEEALLHLEKCDLCAWGCGVNRTIGRLGQCMTSRHARIASFGPHMGEEDPLRGTRGSGTIFIGRCNLRCQYCQNHDISQQNSGHTHNAQEFADIMLTLQGMGCHNINIVSPSHVVAQLIEAVAVAARQGLRLPIVYNTGGFDSLTSLKLLDGIVDIYMPDMKYSDSTVALKYSRIKHYAERNREAVHEMHRQVGDLVLDENGIARRGLLVRHLVLPGGLAGTQKIMQFLADEISRNTYVNIMGQYRPEYRAMTQDLGALSRVVSADEMAEAYNLARSAGLSRFDQRRQPGWIIL